MTEWRNVKRDGLPPCSEEVFVRAAYSNFMTVAYYSSGAETWHPKCCHPALAMEIQNVTHWMEIPELPEEDV